jgi:GxxExxY protein
MIEDAITRRVIGCAIRVHMELGPGYLESVYQNALALELKKAGLSVRCGCRLEVTYRGVVVGEFVADMIVGDHLLVENKAVHTLIQAHEVQLVNYLTATGLDLGLLLNFGSGRLQIRRKTRLYTKKAAAG